MRIARTIPAAVTALENAKIILIDVLILVEIQSLAGGSLQPRHS